MRTPAALTAFLAPWLALGSAPAFAEQREAAGQKLIVSSVSRAGVPFHSIDSVRIVRQEKNGAGWRLTLELRGHIEGNTCGFGRIALELGEGSQSDPTGWTTYATIRARAFRPRLIRLNSEACPQHSIRQPFSASLELEALPMNQKHWVFDFGESLEERPPRLRISYESDGWTAHVERPGCCGVS